MWKAENNPEKAVIAWFVSRLFPAFHIEPSRAAPHVISASFASLREPGLDLIAYPSALFRTASFRPDSFKRNDAVELSRQGNEAGWCGESRKPSLVTSAAT